MRPLENGNLFSNSRKAKISITGIYRIFRGLKFEPDAEIGHKVPFCRGLTAQQALMGQFSWLNEFERKDKFMSEKHPECPLYNPLNCKEYYNPKLCAFVRKDKVCLKKKKPKPKKK